MTAGIRVFWDANNLKHAASTSQSIGRNNFRYLNLQFSFPSSLVDNSSPAHTATDRYSALLSTGYNLTTLTGKLRGLSYFRLRSGTTYWLLVTVVLRSYVHPRSKILFATFLPLAAWYTIFGTWNRSLSSCDIIASFGLNHPLPTHCTQRYACHLIMIRLLL